MSKITYFIFIGYYLLLLGSFGYFNVDYYIEVHDNLDQVHVWLKLLKEQNLFFGSNTQVLPFLGGVERQYLLSELQLQNLIYYLFTPLVAAFVTVATKILIGTGSFYLLSKQLILPGYEKPKALEFCLLAGFIFALLPGYENLYFAQVSIPLIWFLYLKFISSGDLKWLFLSGVYPILSEFPRYGIFILMGIAIHGIWSFFNKSFIKFFRVVGFGSILTFGYMVTDYRLFQVMLGSTDKTIRSEFNVEPFGKPMTEFIRAILEGQYHAQSFGFGVIGLSLLLVLFASKFKLKEISNQLKVIFDKINLNLLLAILIAGLIYSFHESFTQRALLGNLVDPLKGWQFARVVWFTPILWYIFFLRTLVMLQVSNNIKYFCLIAQLSFVVLSGSYGSNFASTIKCHFMSECKDQPSYRNFFDPEFFNLVKAQIEYKTEWSLAFGFHPSVLNFNQIWTLDGYHHAYSLKYKHEFKKLILPELKQNADLYNYFQNWGARAYVMKHGVTWEPTTELPGKATLSLNLDLDQAKKMGLKYIFSLWPLEVIGFTHVASINNLRPNKFMRKIHIYQLK